MNDKWQILDMGTNWAAECKCSAFMGYSPPHTLTNYCIISKDLRCILKLARAFGSGDYFYGDIGKTLYKHFNGLL